MQQPANKQELTIAKLDISHLAAVHAIETLSFNSPWSEQAYRVELGANPLAHYYGCFKGEELLAFVGLWLVLDEGHICNVAVHPAWRGQGLGEFLLRRVLAACQSMGGKSITLEVRESNAAALALYHKLGFYEAGRRPNYYHDTGETALILWLDF